MKQKVKSRPAAKQKVSPLDAERAQQKKSMFAFNLATYFNDVGAEMLNPIMPLFLTTVFHANMEAVGLIDGIGESIVSLSQAGAGYYSDRLKKRKIFIWTGYGLGGLSRLGYALSTNWQMMIPFRMIDRMGKIRGAPRDALVADLSTHENRGKNFGILRTMDNLGAVSGILISIFLLSFFHLSYQTLFLVAAIPSVISVALILKMVKEKKNDTFKLFKGIQLRNLTPQFRLLLFLSALFALGSFTYSFLLLFANYNGFPTEQVPILYLIFTIMAALFSYPFGALSDKIGRKKVILLSMLLWILTCILFVMTNAFIAVVAVFILYGLHKASLDTVQKTFVAELAPQKFRASALGGFQLVVGLCALPASFGAGFLWDHFSPATPFMLSIGLTLVAGGLLLFIKEN